MIDIRHQCLTDGHPPFWAETEAEVEAEAISRLPTPSALLVLRTSTTTRLESFEFFRAVLPDPQ